MMVRDLLSTKSNHLKNGIYDDNQILTKEENKYDFMHADNYSPIDTNNGDDEILRINL